MWKRIKPLLVILSVALNVAFVGVWLVHVSADCSDFGMSPCGESCVPGDSRSVWCPLHRKLNVSDDQWKKLEPQIRAFRAEVDKICDRNSHQRADLLEMLLVSEPNMTDVQAKQEEILAAQRQMQTLVIQQLSNEKKILSPEQQRQLFDLLRSRSDCDHRGPLLVPGRGV